MTSIERLQSSGIRRRGAPERGFRYRRADGKKVRGDDLSRIEALKIPPAWKDVAINSAASGRLQAVGRDAAGRWQYLYHDSHIAKQERKKFERLIEFAQSLPAMRKTIARHLRQPGLGRERVMAAVLRILTMSFMRPGSETYASENGSYGIATLRPKHVAVRGDRVVFDFPGKSGVRHQSELRNRQVARVIKELLKHRGRVFMYQDDGGNLVDVKRQHINAYIKGVMGHRFTAKDFRTWAGTLVCACALARMSSETNGNKPETKQSILAAINETAEVLGNTPAVCRSAYIYPSLISRFEKREVINNYFETVEKLISYRGVSMHPAERALLRFLKN
jgi:DNA topoisomerase I